MRGDILRVIFEMHALARSRVLCQRYALPPFLRRPERSRCKSAAAIRAHVAELGLDAIGTEGALITADPSFGRIRPKILVARFAVRSKLQRHDGRILQRSSMSKSCCYFFDRHSSSSSAISAVAGSRMAEGVRKKRGAGAGWVTPWRLTNVFRAAMCG